MGKSSLFGKNKILVPVERQPTMHALWYRLEAAGEISVNTVNEGTHDKAFQIELTAVDGKKLKRVDPDLYDCMLRLYRDIHLKAISDNRAGKKEK